MAMGNIAALFGFATPRYGQLADTLAIVLDAKLLEDWLRVDMKLRGCFHSGHQTMIGTIGTLLHPKHGYIVQLPELFLADAQRLGMDVDESTWIEFVASRYKLVSGLSKKLVPNRPAGKRRQRSRDKKRKLQEILSHEDAYSAFVFPTLIRMQAERPPPNAPEVVRLDFELHLLTFTLFAACPLRLLNWSSAEWGKHLRRQDAGEWWVHIPLEEQKNRRVLEADLRIVLPNWAAGVVQRYYAEVLPLLAVKNPVGNKYVMASWKTGMSRITATHDFDQNFAVQQIYMSIQTRISLFTKNIWNIAVSPHDWRDIYATDYLNKHPGEILTVATILNDKPETVMREYARPDSARLSRTAARNLEADFRMVASSYDPASPRPGTAGFQ